MDTVLCIVHRTVYTINKRDEVVSNITGVFEGHILLLYTYLKQRR